MLLIDVSPSMFGRPLDEALIGGKDFVDEAIEALYSVGIILWNSGVAAVRPPTEDGHPTYELLDRPAFTGDGTDLYPALVHCDELLKSYTGDRVVAVFGDGDLGTPSRVIPKVQEMKEKNIRFVTRGLGRRASEAFGSISDEAPEAAHVERVEDLAGSIAGMALTLHATPGLRKAGP
jgi:hypothetical protein